MSNCRYRSALQEKLVSITETSGNQQKVSHYRHRFSLEFQLFPLQIQTSGSKRINSVIILAMPSSRKVWHTDDIREGPEFPRLHMIFLRPSSIIWINLLVSCRVPLYRSAPKNDDFETFYGKGHGSSQSAFLACCAGLRAQEVRSANQTKCEKWPWAC